MHTSKKQLNLNFVQSSVKALIQLNLKQSSWESGLNSTERLQYLRNFVCQLYMVTVAHYYWHSNEMDSKGPIRNSRDGKEEINTPKEYSVSHISKRHSIYKSGQMLVKLTREGFPPRIIVKDLIRIL